VVRFETAVLMPVEPEVAFDLSLSIDAHLGSFESSDERVVAGVSAGIIGLGEFVTWRAKHFGITWTMTSTVSEWDRPHRFVDEQRTGPFKSFRHEHVFEPVDNGTRLIDRVQFAAPLGPLGRVAEWLVLDRYMRHLIAVRNAFLITEATRRGTTGVGEGNA
jgi:ligand-binding SRPBCC domain-containing protein